MITKKIEIFSLSIIGLLFIFSIYNFQNRSHEGFLQMHYNWFNIKPIGEKTNVEIDSISYDYLRIKTKENLKNNHDNTGLIDMNGDNHYFKYLYSWKENENTEFVGLVWINGTPENFQKGMNGKYSEVELPIRNDVGKSILMIGDNALIKGEGKYLRRFIKEKAKVSFKGNRKDLFNFRHECSESVEINNFITDLNHVEPSDVYMISLGWKSIQNLSETSLKNALDLIINTLKSKKPESIVLFTIPYTEEVGINNKLFIYNEYLKQLKTKHSFQLIDINEILSRNPASENDNNLSMEDYRIVAKKIVKECL